MKQSIWQAYQLTFASYVLAIIILDLVSLAFSSSHFALVPIALAWLPMVVQAFAQLRKKQIGNEFFLVFATIIAVIGKQEHAIMIVLLIMLIAHYIELLIEKKTGQALEQLINLIPSTVILFDHGTERPIELSKVNPGMHLLVKTGGRIPVDGTIISGQASINEAALTGESMLKEKGMSDQVFAGTFIQAGSIVVQVDRVRQDTLFGKMVRLLEQADKKKARISIITEWISFLLAPALLIFIILVWLITGNFDLVITLFIFGSPLELSLVTPLTVLAASVAAFRHGILVKNGLALEHFAHIDTIIFDKTGTLTLGEPVVTQVISFDPAYRHDDILRLAGIAERRSDHVVAKAILRKAAQMNLEIPQPQSFSSLVGHGVHITFDNTDYYFGNRHFIQAPEHGNSILPATDTHAGTAYSLFYLATGGKTIGCIAMSDSIRPDAQATITHLAKTGIKEMLVVSGDRQEIADEIGAQLGINRCYGNVFPDEKIAILDRLQKSGKTVAMVGDGINDVAALKQAHVGIAMGAMGMEPAIEAADIVLMTNELKNIYFIRLLSMKTFRIIKQNLLFGFLLLHLLGLIMTLLHWVNPIQAALLHSISDILILVNASRLIAFKAPLP